MASIDRNKDETPLVTTRVKRSGGSLIVTIPAPARDALKLAEGQELGVRVESGRLVLDPGRRKRKRYTLEELLAQCDLSIPYTEEERAWLDAPPVGREIL